MRFSISRQLRMYHSDMDVLFSYFLTGFETDRPFASIYMLNDPRCTVADPRYTSSVLPILPSHTLEYRAREHWKKRTLVVLLTNECVYAFGTLPTLAARC